MTTRSSSRSGFIIVAVLAVTALLAGLVAAVSMVSRAGVASARVEIDDLGGDALLRAGLEVAAYELITLGQRADVIDGQLIRLDAGTITVFVLPTGGWIDLNGSKPEMIAAAYKASGLKRLKPEVFADRVADWRDADDEPGKNGAEAEAYSQEGVPQRPANDAFRSTDDLAWVLGVSVADVRKLEPFFTVFNPKGTINLFDAPESVLATIPGFRRQQIERVTKLRRKRTASVSQQLMAIVPDANGLVNADVRPDRVVRVRLEARPNRGAPRDVEVVLVPDPVGREAFRVTSWRAIDRKDL